MSETPLLPVNNNYPLNIRSVCVRVRVHMCACVVVVVGKGGGGVEGQGGLGWT